VSDWRDDLPPIPNERIRAAAIREGARRVEARLRRQRMVLVGGASAAAVALIVFAAAQLDLELSDDDDSGGAATTAGGTTAGTSGTEAPGTTAAPGTTGAPGTTAATGSTAAGGTTGTTGAPATTSPDYTTVGGPIAALPPNATVTVSAVVIWEEPASGRDCGTTRLTVTFDPRSRASQTPVVHWETAGLQDQEPMEIVDDGEAGVTIGPFPADTLSDDTNHEVLIYVTDREAFGDQIFRAPTVILRDCSP
jgi:hypothetical protein